MNYRKRCISAETTLLRIDSMFNDDHRASQLVHEHFLKDFDNYRTTENMWLRLSAFTQTLLRKASHNIKRYVKSQK